MDVVRKDVELLVEKELKAANENNPLFHSMHEGYAVMLEEKEEAEEELERINKFDIDILWQYVRNDSFPTAKVKCKDIKERATKLAVEAIQLAAMAQKFIDSEYNYPIESREWYCKKTIRKAQQND